MFIEEDNGKTTATPADIERVVHFIKTNHCKHREGAIQWALHQDRAQDIALNNLDDLDAQALVVPRIQGSKPINRLEGDSIYMLGDLCKLALIIHTNFEQMDSLQSILANKNYDKLLDKRNLVMTGKDIDEVISGIIRLGLNIDNSDKSKRTDKISFDNFVWILDNDEFTLLSGKIHGEWDYYMYIILRNLNTIAYYGSLFNCPDNERNLIKTIGNMDMHQNKPWDEKSPLTKANQMNHAISHIKNMFNKGINPIAKISLPVGRITGTLLHNGEYY